MGKMSREPADNPPLDRWRVDEMLEPEQMLWGLPAIAKAARVSEATARRWANGGAGAPISKPGGRYFSQRSELMAWLRAR